MTDSTTKPSANNERLTCGGIIVGFDIKNGFRSTEIGTKRLDSSEYAELEKGMANAAASLGDVDWAKFGQPADSDRLPCSIELRVTTQGVHGFTHDMKLSYVIHGTHKWQLFCQAVLQITSNLGFVRDGAK